VYQEFLLDGLILVQEDLLGDVLLEYVVFEENSHLFEMQMYHLKG
jgi:hypothetical protein